MDVKSVLDWLAVVVGLGGALAPLCSALVACLKTALAERLHARYYPTLSLAVGVILAEFVGWQIGQDPRLSALVGVVAGLMASQLFKAGKQAEQALPPHG